MDHILSQLNPVYTILGILIYVSSEEFKIFTLLNVKNEMNIATYPGFRD
jgi:hypothetical protein